MNKKSMLEDQSYVLEQILTYAKDADAVLIAGDVYDKNVPCEEAVELFDWFLAQLCKMEKTVMVISGNHDSAQRLGFGRSIMKNSNVHICTECKGKPQRVRVKDVDFYLLPFVKPSMVKPLFDKEDMDYNEMMRLSLGNIKPEGKSVLALHQFVTAGGHKTERCDSETITVGGVDNIDVSVFDRFDYVALGHIHGAQRIGRDTVRYCGSPLKYSFSEVHHKKAALLVDTEDMSIKSLELLPLHDMREIRGKLSDLLDENVYSLGDTKDYMHVTLTDEEELIDPMGKIRSVYPNTMLLDFDNSRTRAEHISGSQAQVTESKTPYELFEEFYTAQNGTEMTEEMKEIVREML